MITLITFFKFYGTFNPDWLISPEISRFFYLEITRKMSNFHYFWPLKESDIISNIQACIFYNHFSTWNQKVLWVATSDSKYSINLSKIRGSEYILMESLLVIWKFFPIILNITLEKRSWISNDCIQLLFERTFYPIL